MSLQRLRWGGMSQGGMKDITERMEKLMTCSARKTVGVEHINLAATVIICVSGGSAAAPSVKREPPMISLTQRGARHLHHRFLCLSRWSHQLWLQPMWMEQKWILRLGRRWRTFSLPRDHVTSYFIHDISVQEFCGDRQSWTPPKVWHWMELPERKGLAFA